MSRLPIGSMIWLYEPPFPPVEGIITGYERGDLVRLAISRKLVPTPLASSHLVFARGHEWRKLVSALRQDAYNIEQAADAIEVDWGMEGRRLS